MQDLVDTVRKGASRAQHAGARLGLWLRTCPWIAPAVLLIVINYGYALVFHAIVFRHQLCGSVRCVEIGVQDPAGAAFVLIYGAIAFASNVSLFNNRASDGEAAAPGAADAELVQPDQSV